MNTRSILIGTCLVAGLSGLGYLAWYVYGDAADEDGRSDLPDMEQTAASQNHHKPTKQRPPKTATRPQVQHRPLKTVTRPEVQHRPQPKVSPKTQKADIPAAKPVPPQGELVLPRRDEFPLRLGSKGKRVERLQVWLMRNFGWSGKITDVFDKKTEGLLKKHLKKTQLDQVTYNRMKMGYPVSQQPIYKRTTIRKPVYRQPVYNPMTIERRVHRIPVIQHIRR